MKNFEFGYSLSQPREAIQAAREAALHVLEDAERDSLNVQAWSKNLTVQIDDLVNAAQNDIKLRHPFTLEVKKSLLESILNFEDDIRETIRSYFSSISENLNRIKKLNPPLTTQELEPVLQRINEHRRSTLLCLGMTQLDINKLQELKNQLFTVLAA